MNAVSGAQRPLRDMGLAVLTVLAVAGTLVAVTQDPAHAAPTGISYILNPHPDDEHTMWSLIEGSSDNFKVFAFLTQGEQTNACGANTWFQPTLGEVNPNPSAGSPSTWAKWSASCYVGRRASTHAFLANMASSDSSIPGSLTSIGTVTLSYAGFPEPRNFTGTGSFVANKVRVYEDTAGRGVALFFDLGDGDLTVDEVRWAAHAMRNNKVALRIPTNLPERNAIGAYRVGSYINCRPYDNLDHRAVHQALWNHHMFSVRQHGRTCGSDPDRDTGRTKATTSTTHSNMYLLGLNKRRLGPFQVRYGWLFLNEFELKFTNGATSTTAGPPNCGHTSGSTYQFKCGSTGSRVQHFWTRFA